MIIANGATLLASIPSYGPESTVIPRYWVVAAQVCDGDQWVCAYMTTLDDEAWYWGDYYSAPGPAVADMLVRSYAVDLPRDAVIAESRRARR